MKYNSDSLSGQQETGMVKSNTTDATILAWESCTTGEVSCETKLQIWPQAWGGGLWHRTWQKQVLAGDVCVSTNELKMNLIL